VQFSEEEVEAYDNKLRSDVAHQYFDEEGALNFEFHVDYCRSKCVEVVDEAATIDDKVAKMSVRAPALSKPIEILGQDESILSYVTVCNRMVHNEITVQNHENCNNECAEPNSLPLVLPCKLCQHAFRLEHP
jgi:hypothetical protein